MKYRDHYTSTHVIDLDNTLYLVQGDLDDSITMFREIDNLLECERDNVQMMLGDEI